MPHYCRWSGRIVLHRRARPSAGRDEATEDYGQIAIGVVAAEPLEACALALQKRVFALELNRETRVVSVAGKNDVLLGNNSRIVDCSHGAVAC